MAKLAKLTKQEQVLVAIGNNGRMERGYGGTALSVLERDRLVMIDPEWSGCVTLTAEGWKRYELLTSA